MSLDIHRRDAEARRNAEKKYRAYPEYKNTNILGMEEIPVKWGVKKVKFVFNLGRGRVIAQEELEDEGQYPVYSSQTKNNGCLGFIETYDFDCKQITWTTDGANAGTVFLREGKHNCTNVCGTLQPKHESLELEYSLYCLDYVTQFHKRPDTNGAKIMNGEMGEIFLSFPSIEEQKQIANFLDHETAKIDTLIEKQKQLIKLLKEKRQAVISHAVTKGLNPNVPMKDSGIEWLGDVPAHWEVKKISHIALLQSGDAIVSEQIETVGDYPVFGGNGLRGYTNNYNHEGFYILIGRQGALCGNINYGEGKFWASEHAVVVHPMKSFNTIYFGETLRAMNLNQYNVSAAQPGLAVTNITCLRAPFPPIEEQKQIAEFVGSETAKIDKLVSKSKRAIELIQERRTALISAAVTGKIDVSN